MKGFLISQGVAVNEIIRYKHHLNQLRTKCLEFSQKYNNPSIKLIADQLVEHLVEKGGIRYPDKRNAPIYIDDFKEALELAQKILKSEIK